MTVEDVPAVLGTTIHAQDYRNGVLTKFPNHGYFRYQDEIYSGVISMRTSICAECTKAYDKWYADPDRMR